MEKIIIAAAARNNVIGLGREIPWYIAEDLRRFKSNTLGHTVIMGRTTWESLGAALPGRTNVVITGKTIPGAACFRSIPEALRNIRSGERVFFIGGERIFREALNIADTIELTRIHRDYPGDRFFPDIDPGLWELAERGPVLESAGIPYSFMRYRRRTPGGGA
ncbi:MAG: dihydrofolate reductase [Treponema sp.]|jgi:dihydrofolate reductase|nr:dihydrofolate reductase [Treponema sp.]